MGNNGKICIRSLSYFFFQLYLQLIVIFSFSMILYFSIKKYSEFQGPQLLFFGWSTNIDIYL